MKILASLFVAATLSVTASAQLCFGPDFLNAGTCCQPAQLSIPAFPPVSVGGCTVCWTNCNPSAPLIAKVAVGAPVATQCGQFKAPINVADGGTGLGVLTGQLVMDYTRTWTEIAPSGAQSQVWRFVVKADLSPIVTPVAPNPCQVPTCLIPMGPYQTAFYYGYMDYSRECGTAVYLPSLVLFHAADHFIHKAGLSDHPVTTAAGFHPNRSYAIVAPHNTVQPFMPMNLPAPQGPLVGEAMRNVANPFAPGACSVEDRISGGAIVNVGQGCFAPFSFAPPQYSIRTCAGQGSCVDAIGQSSNFAAQNIAFPTLPWVFMVTASIGTWTNPNVWPGNEAVWVDEGLFRTQDICAGNQAFEIYYGATTQMGFQVITSVPTTPNFSFTDLGDNYTAILGGPTPFPILGSVRPTDHLIYLNTP